MVDLVCVIMSSMGGDSMLGFYGTLLRVYLGNVVISLEHTCVLLYKL